MSATLRLDRRSGRSRSALERALLDLIAERDLSQISVSDLTRRAEVYRSTLYEHYTDVHDMAASLATEMFDELIAATAVLLPDVLAEPGRPPEALVAVFAHVAAHARLYRALLDAEGNAQVINHLHQRLTAGIRARLSGDQADGHDPVAAFLAGTLLGTITDWLRHDSPAHPRQSAPRSGRTCSPRGTSPTAAPAAARHSRAGPTRPRRGVLRAGGDQWADRCTGVRVASACTAGFAAGPSTKFSSTGALETMTCDAWVSCRGCEATTR